jgi:hypothetical protein
LMPVPVIRRSRLRETGVVNGLDSLVEGVSVPSTI